MLSKPLRVRIFKEKFGSLLIGFRGKGPIKPMVFQTVLSLQVLFPRKVTLPLLPPREPSEAVVLPMVWNSPMPLLVRAVPIPPIIAIAIGVHVGVVFSKNTFTTLFLWGIFLVTVLFLCSTPFVAALFLCDAVFSTLFTSTCLCAPGLVRVRTLSIRGLCNSRRGLRGIGRISTAAISNVIGLSDSAADGARGRRYIALPVVGVRLMCECGCDEQRNECDGLPLHCGY